METIDFIDAVIDTLGAMERQGCTAFPVSDENRAFLRELYVGRPSTRPAPASPPAPAVNPVAAFQAPSAAPAKPAAPAPQPQPQPAAPAAPAPPFRPPAPTPNPQASTDAEAFAPTPIPEVGDMDWAALESTAKACHGCKLCQGRKTVVFEDGDRTAELMFIGEGPGEDEDQQGVPFVGRAGQLLTKIIGAMGFDRQSVYVANVVKCRPPLNRNPEEDETTACLGFLNRQIQLVQPKAIILLGAVPLQVLLGVRSIMKHRGQWMEYQGIPVMPTYHPSFLLRKPEHKRDVWNDVQQVMQRFGIQPPPSRR